MFNNVGMSRDVLLSPRLQRLFSPLLPPELANFPNTASSGPGNIRPKLQGNVSYSGPGNDECVFNGPGNTLPILILY